MIRLLAAIASMLVMSSPAFAQPGPGGGRGQGMRMRARQTQLADRAAGVTATRPARAARGPLFRGEPWGVRAGCRWRCNRAGVCPGFPGNCRGFGRFRGGVGTPATQPAGQAGRGMRADEHEAIWSLLDYHESVTRSIENLPDGVKTTTTTSRPELVPALRTHVQQMARRLEEGRPVRIWDPVFRDVFEHAAEIEVEMTEIDGGIMVTQTTDNPAVVPVIRAHAQKVAEFARQGHAAVRPPWAGRR